MQIFECQTNRSHVGLAIIGILHCLDIFFISQLELGLHGFVRVDIPIRMLVIAIATTPGHVKDDLGTHILKDAVQLNSSILGTGRAFRPDEGGDLGLILQNNIIIVLGRASLGVPSRTAFHGFIAVIINLPATFREALDGTGSRDTGCASQQMLELSGHIVLPSVGVSHHENLVDDIASGIAAFGRAVLLDVLVEDEFLLLYITATKTCLLVVLELLSSGRLGPKGEPKHGSGEGKLHDRVVSKIRRCESEWKKMRAKLPMQCACRGLRLFEKQNCENESKLSGMRMARNVVNWGLLSFLWSLSFQQDWWYIWG